MKRLFFIIILAGTLLGFYFIKQAVFAQTTSAVFAQTSSIDNNTRQQILEATVQIKMKAPLLDETGQPVIKEINGSWYTMDQMAHGLGTLTLKDNQLFIVTHDHWGALLATAVTVLFQDAQGQQLAEISGEQFRSAIVYQDQGTMVLPAPAALTSLSGQAVSTNSRGLAAGTQVQLVRHMPGSNQVTVVTAELTAVTSRLGVPAYQLQHLDGAPVFEGDSGGGIWLNGQLVGNLWRNVAVETVQVVNGQETATGQQVSANSIAAAHPDFSLATQLVDITVSAPQPQQAEPALP